MIDPFSGLPPEDESTPETTKEEQQPERQGDATPAFGRFSRRSFLSHLGIASIAVTAAPVVSAAESLTSSQSAAETAPPALGMAPVKLRVNGTEHALTLDPRTTLLDCLRENLELHGTKKGCDHGQCGACTVHVNGKRVNSCLSFAVMHAGDEITTIEGLGSPDKLHPVQAAFIELDGYQCGYCTSGQIMSAAAALKEGIGPTDDDVKHAMYGNICRCGAYPNIVAAVQKARLSV